MKKLLLLIAVVPVITTTVANAQPQKGDWMLGAKVNPIALKGGYFLSNRFIAGIDVTPGFSYQPQNKNIGFNFGAEATLRYYFAPKTGMQAGKFYWFGDFNAGYELQYGHNYFSKSGGFSGHFKTGLAPGLAYFVNEKVSIDAALRTNLRGNFTRNWSHINTNPEFGIQIYLPGKKKQAKTE
jgi:hypothetical protein